MTIGTTSDFTVTALELITDALVEAGVLREGDTPGTVLQARCLRRLNLLVKNVMGGPNPTMPGLKVWRRVERTLSPTSGAITYSIKTSAGDLTISTGIPLDVLWVNAKDSDSNETPLEKMTRAEAFQVSNKTDNQGIPTKYYYERERDQGTIRFDVKLNDTTYSFVMLCLEPIRDLDAVSEDMDFEQEYYEPLLHELAMRFRLVHHKEKDTDINYLAKETMARADSFQPEGAEEDDFFQPERY